MAGIKRTAADHWFSLYVRCRDKWTCQRCHTKYPEYIEGGDHTQLKGLHCGHANTRGKHGTRIEPDNACALCYGCHSRLDAHPEEKIAFFKNRLGEERYNELKRLSNKPFKGFFKNNKEHSAKYRKLFREINK